MVPERRLLFSPEPQQAMVARHRLDSLPEQSPELIGERKIGKPFTVDTAMTFGDLQSHGPQQFTLGALRHLKFSDSFGQLFRWEMHGLPQTCQLWQVIQCGAPHA